MCSVRLMRRAALVLVLAAACLAAPAAAPAALRASDFGMPVPVPAGARAASVADGGWTSPVLRAPKRFDVFGLRWGRGAPEHVGARVRTRRAGGRWSPWTELGEAHSAHGTDPAWAGRADELQVRLEHRVPRLRAHFVATTGTAPRPRPLGRAARAGEQPTIVPRAAWGADQCKPRDAPTPGQVQLAFVHHTVGTNVYTPEQSASLVLGICRYHRNANGWDDVGYNFLVDRYGTIFEGRAGGIDQAVVGAQAQGYNGVSTGVANLGTHTSEPQSEAALGSIARLLAWKLPLHGVPVTGKVAVKSAGGETNRYPAGKSVTFERISGHRDGNATSCPGDALYAQLPLLRQLADARAPEIPVAPPPPGGAPTARISFGATTPRLAFPAPAQLAGRMTDAAGQPVAGAPVAVQMLTTGRGFQTIQRTATGGDGWFTATVPTARNRSYRAVRDVTGPERIASPAVPVSVAPAVTAAAATRVRAGGRIVVPGSVSPRKGAVFVSAARRVGRGRHARPEVYRRVALRGARFRAVLRLRRPALYRVRAGFAGDRINAPSRSSDLLVRAVRRGAPAVARPAPAPPPGTSPTGGVTAGPVGR